MTIPRDELRNLSFYRPIPCNPLQILNHKKLRKDDRSTKKKKQTKKIISRQNMFRDIFSKQIRRKKQQRIKSLDKLSCK